MELCVYLSIYLSVDGYLMPFRFPSSKYADFIFSAGYREKKKKEKKGEKPKGERIRWVNAT